jgi:hypothetical protein
MAAHDVSTDQQRAAPSVHPPPGVTLASFTLFGALAALLALIYSGAEWRELVGFGFPSDAAWARAVLARNVASREGLCFNVGTPVAGAAGVSWIGALAFTGFFSGKFLLTAKLLGVLSVILAAFVTWHIVLDLLGDWRFAFLAGLLVAGSPRLASAGLDGTEAAWAALMVTALLHWHSLAWEGTTHQRALMALTMILAALSRPELLLLFPLALADRGLVTAVHARRATRHIALAHPLPETAATVLLLLPYVLYNWRAGGPLWQQPEAVLRTPPAWAWSGTALGGLWADNPLLLCAALVGLPVAALAVSRTTCGHRSFLLCVMPVVLIVAPIVIWRGASPTNAAYMAAYLTPAVAILGAAGLFLAHRTAQRLSWPGPATRRRWVHAAGIAIVCGAILGPVALAHPASWRQCVSQVKKVSGLQAYIGRWAADHLPPDASIASREVGAIGFFSRRRMIDLGGTISHEGLAYLSQPGSPDTNLLAYLQEVKPSHVAIRPGDFPYLSQRADLLTPAFTTRVTDPRTGGETSMTLYETLWPPRSLQDAMGMIDRQ